MDNWSNEAEDDEVRIIQVAPTGEIAPHEPGTGGRPISHKRSTPLPQRARTGSIEEDVLILEGTEIPWDSIQLLSLGFIHHSLGDMDGPKTMMRQMFGKMMGKDEKNDKKAPRVQESILLDIYVDGFEQPFRLESGSVNYRHFLGGEVGFISMHNFYRLVVHLARQATDACLTDSTVAFLNRRKDQAKRYGAVYDFEMETYACLSRLDSLTHQAQVDLSRDNWADEWEETEI